MQCFQVSLFSSFTHCWLDNMLWKCTILAFQLISPHCGGAVISISPWLWLALWPNMWYVSLWRECSVLYPWVHLASNADSWLVFSPHALLVREWARTLSLSLYWYLVLPQLPQYSLHVLRCPRDRNSCTWWLPLHVNLIGPQNANIFQ